MITFDKLKISSRIEYVTNINLNNFEKDKKGNLMYKQKVPYLLTIKINYSMPEVFIEFTGKVLGKQYPQLISLDTIRQCFENINALGICTLDIDNLINDSVVCSCDVTTDVECDDIKGMCSYIRNNISSYRLYTPRQHRNGNFTVSKNVTGKTAMKKLTIYNKEAETNRAENRTFRNMYGIDGNDFKGKCRFELSLDSQAQIRDSLQITDTHLMSVLQSSAHPISDFMDKVLADDISMSATSKKDYIIKLVLQDCHYDIEEVEAKMRNFHSRGNNMSKILAPYRKALNETNSSANENIMRNKIMGMIVSM